MKHAQFKTKQKYWVLNPTQNINELKCAHWNITNYSLHTEEGISQNVHALCSIASKIDI